jgi:hypothetical protein
LRSCLSAAEIRVEAHSACGQRVEKRGEGIVLDKRPGAAAEIYATSVVPVHAQANSIGACDVIRRAGDEKRARCVDVQRLEREPIRLWPWLVRARRLSGSDNVKGDTNLGRSPTTNLVRTVGDNADLHGCAQLGQNGGRFWPGSELTQAGNKRRCTIWRKTDWLGRLGDEVVMRPIVTCQIRKAAVLAPPATAQRCAAGDFVVGRLRVEKPAEKVE